MKTSRYIWFNGDLIPWADAKVHVMTHALHYGSSVFEGIRCYATPDGPAIFRLADHVERLFASAGIYRMTIPFTPDEIVRGCRDAVLENGLASAYLRPLVMRGVGGVGVCPVPGSPVEVMIAAMEMGEYLGEESLAHGIDACVSSWNRAAPNTFPTAAKAGGNYLNSQLVAMEARRNGYAEGIALAADGTLSEGSGENLFIVRKGVLFTPPAAASILMGITRDTVLQLAADAGLTVVEQPLPRELLYLADEVFFTGTAAEITPVCSVDRHSVGSGARGPITAALQEKFFGLFDGRTKDRWGWLDHLHSSARVEVLDTAL
ncbi:MAG TPA: branched-chain amino acid transaminase [Woeseiaceae bacterium]|nr:branched-chain amino acid transaminase [Woeseiaceae bacterium]